MGWIADLLKEVPSAARYKSELEAMERENTNLKAKIGVLEAEKAVFESQIVDLRQEIQRRDDVVKEQELQSHGVRLDNIKERILECVANDISTNDEILKSLDMPSESLRYHLDDPRMKKLLSSSLFAMGVMYMLTKEGRDYCVSHALLRVA